MDNLLFVQFPTYLDDPKYQWQKMPERNYLIGKTGQVFSQRDSVRLHDNGQIAMTIRYQFMNMDDSLKGKLIHNPEFPLNSGNLFLLRIFISQGLNHDSTTIMFPLCPINHMRIGIAQLLQDVISGNQLNTANILSWVHASNIKHPAEGGMEGLLGSTNEWVPMSA